MNWAHLHLALNHIPVLGTLLVLVLLSVAAARKSAELKRFSLWAFVVLTIVSIPIKFTGDYAFEMIGREAWVEESIVQAHEAAAGQAMTGIFVAGLLAGAGLYLERRVKCVPRWLVGALLVASVATFLLMARAANLGGQIRHPEIRPQGARTSAGQR